MFYRCFILPWHHVRFERALSEWSDLLTCSCGRQFGINYDCRIVLPYDRDLEKFYERRDARIRAIQPQSVPLEGKQ